MVTGAILILLAAVGSTTASANGSMSITIPSVLGVRVSQDAAAVREGDVPVTLSLFSSSTQTVVQRMAKEQVSAVMRVSNVAPQTKTRNARSGWSAFTDDVRPQPQRTSNGNANREDVTYEIWGF
jgi:hypothetical protein